MNEETTGLPSPRGYFTITSDSWDEPEIYVVVTPSFADCKWGFSRNRPEIDVVNPFSNNSVCAIVTVWISNWEEIKNNCTFLHIAIPGEAVYFRYLGADDDCNINRGYSINHNMLDLYYGGRLRFNESNIYFAQNFNEWQTDVVIKLNRTDNFAGVISFQWNEAFERTATSRYELLMWGAVYPSKSTSFMEEKQEELLFFNKEVSKYNLLVLSGESYSVINAYPEPSDLWFHKRFGPIYHFDADLSRSAVYLVLQHNSVDKWGRMLLIILSTLLGIGMSLFMQAIFESSRKREKRD